MLAGHVHVPGPNLVLVVVLPQVLLQGFWDWELAYIPVGSHLVTNCTTSKCLKQKQDWIIKCVAREQSLDGVGKSAWQSW